MRAWRPQAGYSGTPLPRKLGIKDDHVVLLDRLPAGLDPRPIWATAARTSSAASAPGST